MKKTILLTLLICTLQSFAQKGGTMKWSFSSKKLATDIFEVTAKAVIERDWHIYSQETGEGSSPTVFSFAENPLIKLDGKVIEHGKMVKKRNDVLDSEIRYYADSVSFVQKVRITDPSLATPSLPKGARGVLLQGTVEFMVCNESQCMPPEEIEFKVELR